ncbi:DUF808 family protein [Campylobacterota bacterium DY0563]
MAGILGYLSVLSDDISTLAGKTIYSATKSLATTFDDIGVLFDDIVTYTKMASSKSSAILVDDLAAISSFTNETTSDLLKKELEKAKNINELKTNIDKLDKNSKENIQKELLDIRNKAIKQAQKNAAKRELPIVYKIAKGSLKNKFIIIPIVLLFSFFAPWLISPALVLGGIYLAFEGVEAILEKFFHHDKKEENKENLVISSEELENIKVKSAIKTDFILSFEIIVIALSLLEESGFIVKLSVLFLVGLIATIAVYGIVALIIKLDDVGFYFQEKKSSLIKKVGDLLVSSMPIIIKLISIIGTIAMLAVGGGIVAHQTHLLHFMESIINSFKDFSGIINFFVEIVFGLIIGFIAVKIVEITKVLKKQN